MWHGDPTCAALTSVRTSEMSATQEIFDFQESRLASEPLTFYDITLTPLWFG
jgi:hypothetical protein